MSFCRYNADSRGGFNLVELLVAIVVLTVVVTMMAAIFRSSQAAIAHGTGEDDIETAGRVAMSMMSADMRSAVADPVLTFSMKDDRRGSVHLGGGLFIDNSEICFLMFQEEPSRTNRSARAIMYWVQAMTNATGRYELVRACYPTDTGTRNCYTNKVWFEDAPSGFGRPTSPDSLGMVAENVVTLRFSTPETGTDSYWSENEGNKLPGYLDIYLELLTEPQAKRAVELAAQGLDHTAFVEKNARRFTTRVYFENRIGYWPYRSYQ